MFSKLRAKLEYFDSFDTLNFDPKHQHRPYQAKNYQYKGSITVTFTGLILAMMLITSFLMLMFRISLISAQIQTNLDLLALSALKSYPTNEISNETSTSENSSNICTQINKIFNEIQTLNIELTVCKFQDNVLTLSAQQTINFWTISKSTRAGYKNC